MNATLQADAMAADILAAQALADRGEYDAAILHATAANRRVRSATLERSLALWRRLAFSGISHSNTRTEWPPVYPDPFQVSDGLPELPAALLDVAHLAGGITHHGALIVRGLLSSQEAGYFVDGIDTAMAVRDGVAQGDAATDSCWHSEFPLPQASNLSYTRPWLRSFGGLLLADSPRMLFDLIETLKHKRIDRLIGDYLGERPVISVGKSTLRRVPITAEVDWHQDGAFLGRDTRTVNLWIALTECGVDAPGLEIVPRRLTGIVTTGTNGAEFDWSVGHETAIQAAAGRPILSPHFKPGDAVFFDQLLLHRTGVKPSMVRQRWAIETWFFAPSTYPMEQEPLVI
jgi:hypothetical protein